MPRAERRKRPAAARSARSPSRPRKERKSELVPSPSSSSPSPDDTGSPIHARVVVKVRDRYYEDGIGKYTQAVLKRVQGIMKQGGNELSQEQLISKLPRCNFAVWGAERSKGQTSYKAAVIGKIVRRPNSHVVDVEKVITVAVPHWKDKLAPYLNDLSLPELRKALQFPASPAPIFVRMEMEPIWQVRWARLCQGLINELPREAFFPLATAFGHQGAGSIEALFNKLNSGGWFTGPRRKTNLASLLHVIEEPTSGWCNLPSVIAVRNSLLNVSTSQ